jgi:hypothetical protein
VPDTWARSPGSTLFLYLGRFGEKPGTVISKPLAPVANATATTPVLGYAWGRDPAGYGFAYVDGAGHVVPYHAAANVSTSTNGPLLNLDPATNYTLTLDSNLTLDPASTPSPNSLLLVLGGPTVSRTIDLNGKTLSITTGGLIEYSPTQLDVTINNGRLGAPNAELLIHKLAGGKLVLGPNLQLGGGTSSIVIDSDPTELPQGPVVFNNNASTFSGGVRLGPSTTTIINDGSVSNNGTLVSGPFGTGTLTLQGGTLLTGGAPVRVDNPVTLAAGFSVPAGGQKITFGGPVTLADGTTHAVSSGGTPVEFAAPIGDGGANLGLKVSGPVVFSATNTYTGPTTISAGSPTFAARQMIGDVTVVSPAIAQFQTSQRLGKLNVGGTATLTAHGAGPLKAISATGLSTSGKIDLTDNAVAVRADTAAGQTAADLLRDMTNLIRRAHTTGEFRSGVFSSLADADPRTGVGVIVNNNGQGQPAFPTLGGESLTTDDVIARWTFLGDANLDGTVGPGDFNQLASHFGLSGQSWQFGDFNLDGIVGAGDFNLLATNFGLAVPGTPSNVTAADWAALEAFDATVVPEPAGAALLMAGAGVLGRRRRR